MSHYKSISQLKSSIKQWEHSFQRKHNHLPTKTDIKNDREIYKLYQVYRNLKKETASHDVRGNGDIVVNGNAGENTSCATGISSEPAESSSVDIKIIESLSDAEDIEGPETASRITTQPFEGLLRHAELGPTPQANGKVLSIFDLALTPPESSPIKPKSTKHGPGIGTTVSPVKPRQSDTFATPTRTAVKRLQFSDLTPSKRKTSNMGISSKLQSLADDVETPIIETPKNKVFKETTTLLDTPLYLAKHNHKFDFSSRISSEAAPTTIKSSPFSLDPSNSQDNPNTPNKPTTINFQISPSPLKSHRFLSFGNCKKVSDLYNEYKSISIEELEEMEGEDADHANADDVNNMSHDAENINSTANDLDHEGNQARKKKPITQKRTTRRWKIKPRADGTVDDEFNKKDIHKEIKKLEEQKQKELSNYFSENISSEDEEEFDSDAELEILRQRSEASATSGKMKPMSNNYQRLKINDPRKKHFKRRMQNR